MSDIEEDFSLNTMYGQSDEEPSELPQARQEEEIQFVAERDTVLIKDAKGNEIRVPSMAYVRRQNETIESQARTIRFLQSREKMMRQAINAHSQDIKDLWKETERKWD